MTEHVDFVTNDWQRGCQRLVAQAYLTEAGIKIDSHTGLVWEDLMRPYQDPKSGKTLDPDSDARAFLSSLHVVRGDSYSFATTLHDEDVCPFHSGREVPFRVLRRKSSGPVIPA